MYTQTGREGLGHHLLVAPPTLPAPLPKALSRPVPSSPPTGLDPPSAPSPLLLNYAGGGKEKKKKPKQNQHDAKLLGY